MKLTGAEIFLESLKQEGVKTLFGLPGGVVLKIFDVLHQQKDIEVILTRHEQGAGHMAEGYAKATGKPGVALGAYVTVLWALGLDKTLDAVAHPDADLHGKTLEASLEEMLLFGGFPGLLREDAADKKRSRLRELYQAYVETAGRAGFIIPATPFTKPRYPNLPSG